MGDRIWAFRTITISEKMKNESQAVESKIVDLLAAMTGDCADAVVVPLTSDFQLGRCCGRFR